MQIYLIKLFANYFKDETNISFKTFIKNNLGENWIYLISKKYNVSQNLVSKKVSEYQTLKSFVDNKNDWNIKI